MVTLECSGTRNDYYAALGCDFCGLIEQELLVGFRACLPFMSPEQCARANPDGLDAIPEDSGVDSVEEEVASGVVSVRGSRRSAPSAVDPYSALSTLVQTYVAFHDLTIAASSPLQCRMRVINTGAERGVSQR